MNRKELKRLVNQHPDIASMRKVMTVMAALWFFVSIVLLFINPVAGLIGLCTLPILLLCYWGALSGRKRRVRKSIEERGVDWIAPQKLRTVQNNRVADAAAAYVVGRSVSKAAGKTATMESLSKNPNTARYAEAGKRADTTGGARYKPTDHICATCGYWRGERQVVKQSGGRSYVQLPRDVKSAKCSKRVRTIYTMETMCREWTPVR